MASSVIELASPDLIAKYEPVIGLEIHAELNTKSKLFSHAPNRFGDEPNTGCRAPLYLVLQAGPRAIRKIRILAIA